MTSRQLTNFSDELSIEAGMHCIRNCERGNISFGLGPYPINQNSYYVFLQVFSVYLMHDPVPLIYGADRIDENHYRTVCVDQFDFLIIHSIL